MISQKPKLDPVALPLAYNYENLVSHTPYFPAMTPHKPIIYCKSFMRPKQPHPSSRGSTDVRVGVSQAPGDGAPIRVELTVALKKFLLAASLLNTSFF